MSETTSTKNKTKAVSLRPLRDAIMPRTFFARESSSWLATPGSIFMLIIFGIIAYVHIVLLWYVIDHAYNGVVYGAVKPLNQLSRFNGQMAILLFSFDFILATRSRFIESLFGGFDRVYKMHSILGRMSMLTAILHFIFQLATTNFVWEYMSLYILPSKSLSILFGQISLIFFFLLVAVSVWVKIPYRIWLWTHKTIGGAFLLSGFHVWLIQPAYQSFDPYRTIFTVIWILGMYCYLYKLILYKYLGPRRKGIVDRVVQHHDIVDLYVKFEGKKFPSRPGDFVFISFRNAQGRLSKEQHPFSISGFFGENTIRLSIKDLGDFTHNLGKAQIGDQVTIYGPYGKFDDKLFIKKNDMVWIGGGIGIAPFNYMAQFFDTLPASGKAGKRKVILYHSVKGMDESIYEEEFKAAQAKDEDFTYRIWDASKNGHLNVQTIADDLGGIEELKKRMVFICGPLGMMHSISKQLIELGVNPRQIIFEEFAFG